MMRFRTRLVIFGSLLALPVLAAGQIALKTPADEAAPVLGRTSHKLASLARLEVPEDLLWDIQGPAEYRSARELEDPGKLLFDGTIAGDGIFPSGPEPLKITLNFVARRAIKSMQVVYDGEWPTDGIPAIPIYAVSTQGDTVRVGLLPEMTKKPSLPAVQQAKWLEETGRAGHEWTRLRIIFPPNLAGLGITEIRIQARDAALRRIASAANRLSKKPELISTGTVSQLTMALRVRRAKEKKKARIERIVSEYSRIIENLSGISLTLDIVERPGTDEPGQMQVKLQNTSEEALVGLSVRVELPPGWRAAPARLQIKKVGAKKTESRMVRIWSDGGSDQALEAYLVGAWNEEPFFLASRCPLPEEATDQQQ